MNDAIYESIAKLIVKANEFKKAENISAKHDYDSFGKDLKNEKIGKVGILSANVMNAADYSAYLNRLSSAGDIGKSLNDEAEALTDKSEFLSMIADAQSKMAEAGIQAENANKTYEWNYQKERDEKNDYFYELKQELKAQNKNSSSGKTSSSGGNKTNKETEEETLTGAYYIDKMPAFCGGTSLTDRLNNEVYSQKFKEKALQISSDGTKKATSSELNALVKMAEKYGASDAYIKWIHNVCGYG